MTQLLTHSRQDIEYRDIPGFPGYRVGSDGSVLSCWKQVGRGTGKGSCRVLGEVWKKLKPGIGSHGYWSVVLARKGEPSRAFLVHRLVLLAFVGPCPKGGLCRHINGIRTDSRKENLAWGTPSENSADSKRHGTAIRKLTDQQINTIILRHSRGETQQSLANEFGIARSLIGYHIRRRAKQCSS